MSDAKTRELMASIRKKGAPAQEGDRQSRRKMETRQKLIRATVEVMAEKGPHAPTINEITDAADVGFGSFFNYFKSKDEIRQAALEELVDRVGDEIDKVAGFVADPIEVFASSMRIVVATLLRRPEWADFLLRIGYDMHDHTRGLYPRMRRDLQFAFDSGRLTVEQPDTLALAVAGAFLGMLSGVRRGAVPAAGAPERIASVALGILGLPQDEIRRIVTRPLPKQVSVARLAKM